MKCLQQVSESSPKVDYIDELERYGFSIIQEAVDVQTIDTLLKEIENAQVDEFARRAGRVFGRVLPQSQKSFLDRVSTGSDSDLINAAGQKSLGISHADH